jgi:hypothetical protein
MEVIRQTVGNVIESGPMPGVRLIVEVPDKAGIEVATPPAR